MSAQQNPADALNKLFDDYPQEKIYIWFNKPAYVAGETAWFKAYVFSGYDISFLSTSLYVELYNAEKKLISTRLLPLINGTGEGSIDLESKLDENVYFIRAYTQWMLNFSEAFQYIHPLLVYNPSSKTHLSKKDTKWTARAFAEGGSLINGIETKIAVRRYAESTQQLKWGGYLYEESNPTIKIKEFNSLDENAGLFSFIPEAGKKYLVHVFDDLGNFRVCPLPAVKLEGVSFSVDQISDSITYTLHFQNIPGNGNGYIIIGDVQHQLVYQANLKKTSSKIVMKMGATELNNGILHLTVLDPSLQPVAERLVFLNRQKLNFDSTSVTEYNLSGEARSMSNLKLKVDTVNWMTYTISVLDATAPSSVQEGNILSALWLTSDIASPLQNPASYFINGDKNKNEALDAIMISEKWVRFDWDEILNNRFPQITHIPLNYLSYTGRVKKGNKLRPNEDVNILLYYPDSSSRLVFGQTDSVGSIQLDNIVFFDELRVFYQSNSKKGYAKSIEIDFERNNRFTPYTLPLPPTPYILTTSTVPSPSWVRNDVITMEMKKSVNNKFKTLQEVVIQSKLRTAKQELDQKLSSPMFRGSMNEYIFDFVNEQQFALGYTSIIQWLQGRVAGLEVRMMRGEYVPYIRGSQARIYIDEMPADPNWANNVFVGNIAMVKVIKGPSIILGASSVIAIYTLRGNMQQYGPKVISLPSSRIRGYDAVKKFYLPDYNDKSIPEPDKDVRNQLLWSTSVMPALPADSAIASFFNNDHSKQFRITVQGITEAGLPVYFDKIVSPAKKSF